MKRSRRFFPVLFVLVFALSLVFSVSVSAVDAQQGESKWNIRQRPAQLVSKDAAGVYKISNFRWGFDEGSTYEKLSPKWRTATIDTGKVKDVLFIVKPFAPEWIAAHCLLFFVMEDSSPVVSENRETSKGFCLSIEARLQKGQTYSLMQGNFGKFFIVYQLSCVEDYVQICSLEGKRLIPYRLKLTAEQKAAFARYVLDESLVDRDDEKYNTVINSCTNNLFIMLNYVLPPNQQFKEWILKKVLYNLSISMPRTAGKILKKHDLVAETLPVIKPASENRRDLTTKEMTGADLDSAKARLAKLEAKVDEVKNVVVSAVSEGLVAKDTLKTLVYDEVSECVSNLHIPGVVPGEANNGEFFIGKQFADNLDSAATTDEVVKQVVLAFDAYKQALPKRVLLEGPDVFNHLNTQMDSMKKSVDQIAKYSELNSRN